MVDLPIGDDYYYDDYMYEVEDVKPLPLPPMPTLKPSRLEGQSIKLNKAELMELYEDLSDVLDEMPQNLPNIKPNSPIMTQMPVVPPPIELEEEDLIKFKNIHTKGDLLALYADLSDVLDEMQNINFPIGKKHALKRYEQFVLNTSCFIFTILVSFIRDNALFASKAKINVF